MGHPVCCLSLSPKYVQFVVVALEDEFGDVLHPVERLLVDGVGGRVVAVVHLVPVGRQAEVEHPLHVHHRLLLLIRLLVGIVLPQLRLPHQLFHLW